MAGGGGVNNWATLFLWEINTGTWPSWLGSLKTLRQQCMFMSLVGLRPEKAALEITN
jgi:hypothetical protein